MPQPRRALSKLAVTLAAAGPASGFPTRQGRLSGEWRLRGGRGAPAGVTRSRLRTH
jgi:hypothetical protein